MIRVIVTASSHRERLRLDALVRQTGVAQVVSGADSPDVAVTDAPEASPNGVPALVLSPEPPMLDGPVRGTLPPEASPEELAAALRAVEAGLMVSHPAHRVRTVLESSTPLTPRESEVLAMLAEGIGNKIIAGRLGISENTVKFHVSSIMEKLDAGSRTEAVARGLRQGLVII